MSATALLSETAIKVAPGQEETLEVRARNSGDVVDELRFEVVGDASSWSVVDPPSVSLFPEGETTVTVRFRPPVDPAPTAGHVPFAVAVTCREDPQGGVVEEGTVEVLPRAACTAELMPRISRGSRAGRYEVAVDNRGNVPLQVELAGIDPNEAVVYRFNPAALDVPPDTAAFSKLTVRPTVRFLRGPEQNRVLHVMVTPDIGEAASADGTFVQQPLIPKWLPKAALATLAALAALAVLWLAVLKPAIRSEAKNAASQGNAEAKQAVADAGQTAANADRVATALEKAFTGTTPQTVPTTVVSKVDFRLDPTHSHPVEPNTTLTVTDLVFNNPDSSDAGTITLQRNSSNPSRQGTLLKLSFANFRDLDFHFATPIEVQGGETLLVAVDGCIDQAKCNDSGIYVGGEQTQV
jgi:hypothetical protein